MERGIGGAEMNWLRETLSDSSTGRLSSKRVAMMMATSSLSISTIILAVAALMGRQVDVALGAVSVPLAGLGGYSYVNGKATDRAKAE